MLSLSTSFVTWGYQEGWARLKGGQVDRKRHQCWELSNQAIKPKLWVQSSKKSRNAGLGNFISAFGDWKNFKKVCNCPSGWPFHFHSSKTLISRLSHCGRIRPHRYRSWEFIICSEIARRVDSHQHSSWEFIICSENAQGGGSHVRSHTSIEFETQNKFRLSTGHFRSSRPFFPASARNISFPATVLNLASFFYLSEKSPQSSPDKLIEEITAFDGGTPTSFVWERCEPYRLGTICIDL